MHGFRIKIVATIEPTAEIGSKKSIKSQFKYNLDRILDGGRSNRISLDAGWNVELLYFYQPEILQLHLSIFHFGRQMALSQNIRQCQDSHDLQNRSIRKF